MIFSFGILNIHFRKTRYLRTFPYKFKGTLWSSQIICIVKKFFLLKYHLEGKCPTSWLWTWLMQNLSIPSLYGSCWRQNCVHAIKLWFVFIHAHILIILIWDLHFSLFSGTTWLEPKISGNSKIITTPPNMQGWGGKNPSCLQNQYNDTPSSSYLLVSFLFTLPPIPLAGHCCGSLLLTPTSRRESPGPCAKRGAGAVASLARQPDSGTWNTDGYRGGSGLGHMGKDQCWRCSSVSLQG